MDCAHQQQQGVPSAEKREKVENENEKETSGAARSHRDDVLPSRVCVVRLEVCEAEPVWKAGTDLDSEGGGGGGGQQQQQQHERK